MEALMQLLAHFFAAHAIVASSLGLWVALATLVNRSVWPKRPSMGKAEKAAHFLLVDLPAAAAAPSYRGFFGALNIPFFSWSMDPGAAKALHVVLPLTLMLASGCAGWPIFKNCEKPVLAKASESSLVTELIADALSSDYMGALVDLGKKIGMPTLDCMAKSLYADAQANPKLGPLVTRLKAYLDARAAQGASLDCKPRPFVTVRVPPHDELAWFADGPDMTCVAHNPTNRRVTGKLECLSADATYATSLPIDLKPGEVREVGFCQVMNKDVHAEPCWIAER